MQRQITRLPMGSLANGLVQPHRNMPSPAFRVRRSPLSVATAVAVGPVVDGRVWSGVSCQPTRCCGFGCGVDAGAVGQIVAGWSFGVSVFQFFFDV